MQGRERADASISVTGVPSISPFDAVTLGSTNTSAESISFLTTSRGSCDEKLSMNFMSGWPAARHLSFFAKGPLPTSLNSQSTFFLTSRKAFIAYSRPFFSTNLAIDRKTILDLFFLRTYFSEEKQIQD